MKIVWCLILILGYCQSYGQGAWNIEYLPLDSINKTHIGKEIRIDFRNNVGDSIKGKVAALSVRKLLSTTDTANLTLINNEAAVFAERWKIYPDHGAVSDQILQRIDTKGEDSWIKEMYLRSITRNFLSVEVYIYTDRSQGKQEILIPKAMVKGVLMAGTSKIGTGG